MNGYDITNVMHARDADEENKAGKDEVWIDGLLKYYMRVFIHTLSQKPAEISEAGWRVAGYSYQYDRTI